LNFNDQTAGGALATAPFVTNKDLGEEGYVRAAVFSLVGSNIGTARDGGNDEFTLGDARSVVKAFKQRLGFIEAHRADAQLDGGGATLAGYRGVAKTSFNDGAADHDIFDGINTTPFEMSRAFRKLHGGAGEVE
jgi:hypothetical protein